MAVMKVNNDTFQEKVLNNSKPVLVDFYADWCGPCRMVGPVIDEIAQERPDIKVGKINVDENSELAMKYSVMSIPNMKFFKGGQVVDEVIGAVPKPAMKQKFEANA